MKFIANHTVQVGKAPNVKTIEQGQTLPKLPVDELMRLQDLDAITGVDEPAQEVTQPAPVPVPVAPVPDAAKA